MKRILKILFSRTILIVFSVLIQLSIIFFLHFADIEELYIFQIIGYIWSAFTFFKMVNKKEFAEFKLPWVIIFLTMPIVGLVFYYVFANRKLSKKQIRAIYATKKEIKNSTVAKVNEQEVKNLLADNFNLEQYLINVTNTHGHTNNQITYFPSGETFFENLIKELKKAKKFIFMEYFIIAEGKLWSEIYNVLEEKASQGVDVKLIYDDVGSIGRVPISYPKKLAKKGIDALKFNPIRPIIKASQNNRDHRKITVIDGVVGFTGGANIADEYVNVTHPLGHWKDSGIMIRGCEVSNLTSLFLQLFSIKKRCTLDFNKYLNVTAPAYENQGFVHFFGDSPSPFDTELTSENTFLHLINTAKNYIYITTPYLVTDHTMMTAIRNASLRGVDVRIITPGIPDKKIVFNVTRSHYDYLTNAGVKIFEYSPGFMHAKTILVDDTTAFVGTVNMDYRSLVHHFECGAIIYKAPCLEDIKKDLMQTFSVSEQKASIKMNKFSRLINSLLAIFYPLL